MTRLYAAGNFSNISNIYFFVHFSFLRFYLFIFRERKREEVGEGEKDQCVVASRASPMGNLAHNPGMCPDWESNQ